MDLIVTTAQQTTPSIINQAEDIAERLAAPFIPRNHMSLNALKEKYKVSQLVVATTKGPVVHTPVGEYFFHLSMAELRIKNIVNGNHDHMVTAMSLMPGMSVLDCTLGLATDAIVASFVVGDNGTIVGLESSPVIAMIAGYGLQHFAVDSEPAITSALRRITVTTADYSEQLQAVAANSYDVVYFDPMFRVPIVKSSNVNPIRTLANMQPLSIDAIWQACRVARSKVVVKEAAGSSEFGRLGMNVILGGKYSSVNYGIIDCRPSLASGGQP